MQGIELLDEDWLNIEREACKRSLATFIRRAWAQLEPGQPYSHGWHMDAIGEHLEAVTKGQIKRLLINIPPGTMKSMSTSVFWPAWEWGPLGMQHIRFIGASHEEGLATRDSMKMRRLVQSDWYQRLWPLEFVGDQNQKTYFENSKTGWRQSCPVKSMTGKRGDRVLWDDPHSVEDAYSVVALETSTRIFKETLPTRLNNPDSSAIIIVMQRLNESDVSGEIIKGDYGYEHLCLPMEYESSRPCVTVLGSPDPRKEDGELLFPARFPRDVVTRDKKIMGEYAVAGQFQQRPSPLGGGIFKTGWWRYYQLLPAIKRIIQSWDTAFAIKTASDYTVCTTWAECESGYYLIDLFKQKLEFPDLKRSAISLYAKHKPHAVLVEDKASGQSLIQELKRETRMPIVPIKVDTDKVSRAYAVTPLIESGRVFLPDGASWLAEFISSMGTFPNAAHDDDVDSVTQALNYLARGGGATGLLDYYAEEARKMREPK